jgi:site-specific DNA recombinase
VVFIYRDEAESGKDTQRPMFKEMLSCAERGGFDVLMFWKLDRFSRSLMHAVQLEAQLRKEKVALYSVTEQIDTTSAPGRFNFRNIASAAEFERDMIQERTRMSLQALAAEHKWPNNTPPLGYRITSDGRLEVIEKDRDLVVTIFNMYQRKQSMPAVATELNKEGIEMRDGARWTPRSVGDILRNEIYTGHYSVGNISDYVEDYRIISEEQYEVVKEIRHRFQRGERREAMPSSRKEPIANKMFRQYCEYLEMGEILTT